MIIRGFLRGAGPPVRPGFGGPAVLPEVEGRVRGPGRERASLSAAESSCIRCPRTRRNSRPPKRISQLELLSGSEKDMLLAFAEAKGFQGLTEKEALGLAGIEPDKPSSSRPGSSRKRVRRASWPSRPFTSSSQESFDFLCAKITEFLGQFHEKHPDIRGVAPRQDRQTIRPG